MCLTVRNGRLVSRVRMGRCGIPAFPVRRRLLVSLVVFGTECRTGDGQRLDPLSAFASVFSVFSVSSISLRVRERCVRTCRAHAHARIRVEPVKPHTLKTQPNYSLFARLYLSLVRHSY